MVGSFQPNRQDDQVIDAGLLLAMMVGVAAAAFVVGRSPTFWFGLGRVVLSAAMPKILRTFKPRNMTKEEKDQILTGQDPFSGRLNGRRKGW